MSCDFLCSAATVGGALFLAWCLLSLCRGVVPFTARARRLKETKAALAAARTFILSYEDLPAFREGGASGERMQSLRAAWEKGDAETCRTLLAFLDPPRSCAAGREWLDVLVVSISVAMAFRAYFYEPFNIPTGSMQPTLYGNHSEACSPAQATVWDTTPLKWGKWLVTGRMYTCFTAPFAGRVVLAQTNTGHYDMRVQGAGRVSGPMLVPTDVLSGEGGDAPDARRAFALNGLALRPDGGGRLVSREAVAAGQVLWSGYVVTGDFLFVNRWLWNFRHPRLGDVMVFNTTGIPGLAQGTHYIKRMTGTPGDVLSFEPDGGSDRHGPTCRLVVNGAQPMEPTRIGQIQRREKFDARAARPYDGYRPAGGLSAGLQVKLGSDEYFACGDNSLNSYDSRYWGVVPAAKLCGVAGGVFWPFSHRWGAIQ